MRWPVWILLAVAMTAVPHIAQAQTAEAHDARARSLFDDGKYSEAARAFEAADQAAPHAASKYNAGYAWDRAGDMPRAADAYRSALSDPVALGSERVRAAKERLSAMEAALGVLVFSAPGAQVSVAHAQQRHTPCEIALLPGNYSVVVQSDDGASEVQTVEVKAGARQIWVATKPTPKPVLPQPGPAPTPEQQVDDPRWYGAAVALAVGGAGALATAGLGFATVSARDNFVDEGTDDPELRERAVTLKTTTNVVLAVSGAALATGLVLIVWAAADPAETPTTQVGLGAGSVRLFHRF